MRNHQPKCSFVTVCYGFLCAPLIHVYVSIAIYDSIAGFGGEIHKTFDSPIMMQYHRKIYIYSRCDNGDSVQNKCRERVKDNNLDL